MRARLLGLFGGFGLFGLFAPFGLFALFALFALGACFQPSYPEGLTCGAGAEPCPPGQRCGADGRCQREPGDRADAAVDTGDAAPLGRFGMPVLVAELDDGTGEQDPALDGALLELVFASDRMGGIGATDLYFARRGAVGGAFELRQPDPSVNSTASELHPWLRADGLELYFESTRLGTNDLFRTRRASLETAWDMPVEVPNVNTTTAIENGPAISADGTLLLLSSDRDGVLDLYLARRPSPEDEWSMPVHLPALSDPAMTDSGPALSATEVYFARFDPASPATTQQLWRAPRTGPAEFGMPEPVAEIPIPAVDPWISEDGRTLFYSSGGNLYMATR